MLSLIFIIKWNQNIFENTKSSDRQETLANTNRKEHSNCFSPFFVEVSKKKSRMRKKLELKTKLRFAISLSPSLSLLFLRKTKAKILKQFTESCMCVTLKKKTKNNFRKMFSRINWNVRTSHFLSNFLRI